MNRTRLIFFLVIAAALVIVGAGVVIQLMPKSGTPAALTNQAIEVRVVTALAVEPWVTEAAKSYNASNPKLEGRPIHVTIIPIDGLSALARYDSTSFEQLPTAWIPDSRYLVELANAVQKEKQGRDVFLTDGEYRARPIVLSLFAWGIYQSRAVVLEKKFGEINWKVLHDAAITKGGWPELGGDRQWGYFKLVVPNPRKNVGGLAAMVAAAGEYYDRPDISTADVTDPKFQLWLKDLMGAVTDISGASAYTAEDFALLGYSVGDGGQLLESDLLANMGGIQTRWGDPLVVRYPKYVTWFDFPFSVWMGPETTAAEKNAALEFEKYLLSRDVQAKAVAYGLRQVHADVNVMADANGPFAMWQKQGVVAVVPSTSRMRSPGRDVLQALLRWFDLNVAKR